MIMNMMIWQYMSTRRMASQFAALPQKEKNLLKPKLFVISLICKKKLIFSRNNEMLVNWRMLHAVNARETRVFYRSRLCSNNGDLLDFYTMQIN